MRILLTEQRPGDAAEVAARLGAAGHELTYCHGPRDGQAWCSQLGPDGRCPLAEEHVSVVVDARATNDPPTVRELGALCALRHGTAVVVAGPSPAGTRGPWQLADARCKHEDVVEACRTATSITSPTVNRTVSAIVRNALRHASGGLDAQVVLTSRGNLLQVLVTTDAPLPVEVAEEVRLAVRVALAAYTPFWRHVPVTFLTSGFTWPTFPAAVGRARVGRREATVGTVGRPRGDYRP
jgi:hypothetical protein